MTSADLQQHRARLDRARTTVRTGTRWTIAVVFATSLLGIGAVWLLELAGFSGTGSGVVAGMLLVIWMVSGAALLLVFMLLGLAALTSGGLRTLEHAMENQRLDDKGQRDV